MTINIRIGIWVGGKNTSQSQKLLEGQTTCVAKELTDWDIKLPIEVQTSKPKRESPDLIFNSLLTMINFFNHYLLMNYISRSDLG